MLCLVLAGAANAETRKLKLYFLHTGEKDEITFKRNGKFIDSGLKKINHFLRDWRRNEPTKMDPRLLDLIWEVYQETGSKNYIHVISAYRSPATNSMLRKRGRGVATKSQHTLGKALDFFIPGVKLQTLRNIGLRKGLGGVGFYPRSGSPFVHMDTGRVRHWPRMNRKELVKVFPKGNTLHVPTDGKPLKRYNQAKAEYERKLAGRGKIVVAKAEEIEKKPGFFARVLGRGGDDDEGASVVAATTPRPVRTTAPPVATPTPQSEVPSPSQAPATQQAVLSQGPIVESVASQMAALPTSITPVPTQSRRKQLLAQADQQPAVPVPDPNEPDPAIEIARTEEEDTGTQLATVEPETETTRAEEAPLEVASAEVVEPELPNVAVPVAATRPQAPAPDATEPAEAQPPETQIALLEPEVGLSDRDGSPAIPAQRPAAISPQTETNEPEQSTPVVIASAPARVNDDYIDLRSVYQQSQRQQQVAETIGQPQTPPALSVTTETPVEPETRIATLPIEPGTLQKNELAVPVANPNRPAAAEIAAVETAPIPLEPGVSSTGDAAFPVTSPQRPAQTIEIAAAEPLQPIEPGTNTAGQTGIPSTNPARPVEVAAAAPEPIEPGIQSNGLPGVPRTSPSRPEIPAPVEIASAPEPIEPGTQARGVPSVPVTSPNRPEQPAPVEIAAVEPTPIEPGVGATGLPAFPSTGPARLRQAAEQRLAYAFPNPLEPGSLTTGQPGYPTTNPQRVAEAPRLEPIEPNAIASGDVTTPITSPRRGAISVASLIEEAQVLEPIDPEFVANRSGGLPQLSPERVKQDRIELAALDAQRQAATSQTAQRSLIDLKSTVIDTDVLSRTSLASAEPLTRLGQIRPPAYGQNILRQKPATVLSQGFNNRPNTNVSFGFSGNAVQLLNFNKFN